MIQSTQFIFLSFAIFGAFTNLTNAIPLLSSTLQPNGAGEENDNDVIEITANVVENANIETTSSNPEDIIDLSFFGSALFGTPDFDITAALVANYTAEEANVNPEELGSYLEGDILVPINNVNGELLIKNGVEKLSYRWPNAIVPFEIRGNFNARELATIQNAIEEYHTRTCIRFVPRTTETDYISIVNDNSGCWSSVGRNGGKQEVNLQSPGCLSRPGTTIHELMHALGFLHEQNREERDSYVSIQFQNIVPAALPNFVKASKTVAFGVPYDYGSVMHYSANAFSANGRPTILPKAAVGDVEIGQRKGFSEYDVQKLNEMYGCRMGGGSYGSSSSSSQNYVPVPVPAPATIDNNIISSFLGGFLGGLGLGDEHSALAAKPTIDHVLNR